jgi:hypothetical protein
MVIVYVLAMLKPEFLGALTFDLAAVRRGQIWRLVTYLFIPSVAPTPSSAIWLFFAVYWTWLILRGLEQEWGAFRLNAYYLVGMIGTTLAATIAGGAASNEALNLSMFLAFATIFPNYEIRLFFVLPVKVKWLAILAAGYLLYTAAVGSWLDRASVVAASGNYLLFFGAHLLDLFRKRNLQVRQTARRADMRTSEAPTDRTCALCGKRQSDGEDIRVCTCDKCKPSRSLCLEHARNH